MNQRPANHRIMQAVRAICARRSGLSVPVAALLGFSMVSVALAGPTGGVVVNGEGTISTPGAGRTVIDQTSQHLQVNWNTFNVGANESVRFQQPSSSAVALNRILDQNPSQIFGRLDANGQVILVNPNGMLFGPSAQLNVGSLVASSLDVIGFDAATGRYTFGTSRTDVGAIVNDGAITAARGGSVTLLGGRVTNTGSILADFGTVNLAAGRAATLDLAGDGLLRLEVDGELLSNNAGASAAVENGGAIQANGGQVLLTAQAVDDVFANLVNNTGVVRANRIDDSGGTIRLIGAGGTVRSSGVLDASAGDAVSSGGTVEMLGEHVGLFDAALVDVSGATSGGTALIGGDYQGKNPDVLNAARTYVSGNASIRADAGLAGDGGRVIVWADEITRFNGSISARGGTVSGDGGFAEVSGKEHLVFRGTANLSAPNGFAGELLLDPRSIVVQAGGEGDLAGDPDDDGLADVYAFEEDADTDITIAPTTITGILDGGTTVTLQAHNDITVTDAIDASGSTTPGGGLIFQAGDDIAINADVLTNNGAIQFTAGDDAATPVGADAPVGELTLLSGVTLSAGAEAVTLISDGYMQLLGTVSGNAITATSGGALTVATLNAGAGAVSLTAAGSLLDDGNNTTRITGGALTMSAAAIGASGTNDEIDTAALSLDATASNGGVYIGELDGLTLTDVSASGAGNDVSVTSTTGNIVVNAVSAPDSVTLAASAGAIIDDGNSATRIAADDLTLSAGTSIGTSIAALGTDVSSLTATATNGGIYIAEADDVSLTSVTAGGTGHDIDISSANGDITVSTITATGDAVTLTATTGAIADDDDDATRIAAATLTLTGTAIGTTGAAGQIDTNVTSLTASASAGGVHIGELNGLTLTNVSAAGAGSDVSVTSTTGDIVVNAVSAPDSVTLAASAGAIIDDGNVATRIAADNLTLSAGTSIGTSIAALGTDVSSLTATATNGGIYIAEANGVSLTSVTAGGTGHDIDISSANGDITVSTIAATGDAVTLTATTGAIVDDGDNDTRIAAGTLTLAAGTEIGVSGASGEIDTNVTSLTATAAAGGVYVGELNGLTLTNVSAGGAGNDVNVTSATGDIAVNTVAASDAVTLTATAGDIEIANISAGGAVTLTADAITDDDNDATVISGGSVSLSAATNIGTVTDFAAVDDADVGSSLDVQTNGALTASVTSNSGQINLNISGTPTLAAGAVTLGTGPNPAGYIVLQSAGDLNVAGLAPGAINIGSGNTTSVGLRSGGVLTLPASGGFTDAPAARLLVRGATDVVDSGDADSRELAFAATALDFRSGAQGGATTLNTTVDELSASVGNDQDLTVNETDGLTLGTLDAGAGNITLTASGAIVADAGNQITASSLTATGSSIGTGAARLNTTVNSLNATSTNGGIFITEANALNLTASATNGAADVRTTNGALAVTSVTGNGVTLAAGGAGNGIALNGAINAGSGDVTLTAGTSVSRGAIVAGAGNQIAGGSLTAMGSMIGTGAARLNSSVASLNATSTNGGIFIDEANALNLTASATNGTTDVRTTNGALAVTSVTGDGVTLTAGGAGNGITLNGAVNAGTGDVTLTAGTAASGGAIVAGIGSQIAGSSLTASGSTIGTGAARLNTTVDSLNATSTNGGIYITEANALNLTASATNGAADVRTTNGALAVTSVAGNGVTLAAGGAGNGITLNGAVNAAAGDVTLTASGAGSDITLNSTVNAGTGDVTLTAGTAASGGAIVAGIGSQIAGSSLTASGSMIGTGAARLNTTVASLNATSTNGGIFITEADALNLTASATNGAADVRTTNGALAVTSVAGNGVTLTAGGAGNGIALNGAVSAAAGDVTLTASGAGSDITLNSTVNAGAGDVTLTAGTAANRGAIVAGTGNQVTGNALTATGSAIGTGAARLNTAIASLNATSTNGGIFITEANALNLAASATNGATDVRTTNGALAVTSVTGDGVTLTAGGAGNGITLNGAVNAGTGDVTLTAGTAASRGAIVAGAGSQIIGGSLTASGSMIGTGAARLITSVNTLNALSTNGGIFIDEADALNLTANATGGAVDVQTGNGALTAAAVSGDGVMLTAGGAGNAITLNGALNAGTGDVTLTAGTPSSRGAIVGGAGHSISGTSLTATAATIGASNARLNTSIETLNAVASTGYVYISEQNGVTLANVSAAHDIDVTSVAGDIVVSIVAATDGVTLTATSGAIDDDGDDSTRLSANALTLSARSIGAASTLSGTTLDHTARLDTDVTTLNATATAGGIFIEEANGLQNVNVQASGGAVGDIELLTHAGDLNLQHVSASDTLLLAAGRNIFAAPGASPVTARVAELRAGTTDPNGGQIGKLSDLLELQLSAGNSLRLFVPQTVDTNDPNRAPATLPSAGVTTTLNLFAAQSSLAALAGFNQFQGLGETQFTSPAEALVRNLQSQTGTVQAGLDIDWVSFDSDVSLFGTLEPAVCLPGDQRDEETSTPEC